MVSGSAAAEQRIGHRSGRSRPRRTHRCVQGVAVAGHLTRPKKPATSAVRRCRGTSPRCRAVASGRPRGGRAAPRAASICRAGRDRAWTCRSVGIRQTTPGGCKSALPAIGLCPNACPGLVVAGNSSVRPGGPGSARAARRGQRFPAAGWAARRRCPAATAAGHQRPEVTSARHNSSLGCGSHRCRSAASASSNFTRRCRPGEVLAGWQPSRQVGGGRHNRAMVIASWRTCGIGPTVVTRARHDGGCQAKSRAARRGRRPAKRPAARTWRA